MQRASVPSVPSGIERRRVPFRAMGGPAELHLEGTIAAVERAERAAIAEIERLEAKFSRYSADSLASRINASAGEPAGVEIDPETHALLDYAERLWEESDGLFDITSGVLRRCWDWKSGQLPSRDAVAEVLPLVGFEKLERRREHVVLPIAGMEIDFGGYVKEYAADRCAEVCRRAGVRHGLVDLAGDLTVVGPHTDGRPWSVGIRDPRRRGRTLATVALHRGGLASSGDYERCIVVDGVRYGHILDPRTGWPVTGGLIAASVIAEQCLLAGTATTVAMLKGESDGARWLDDLDLPHIRVDAEGHVGGTIQRSPQPGRRASATRRARP